MAFAYHAGLSQKQREKVQDRFLKKKSSIVVATIAFGMGIDKPDVRFVAHMDLPKCLESYYQETGRAGRDGLPANAWMLYGMRDLILLKSFTSKGIRSAARRRVNEEKLDAILGFCETTKCRREVLLNYFDDNYKGPCENCDTCDAPNIKQINATKLAITALSCVYETKQQFNVHYMVDVLRSNLVGAAHDEALWYSVFRQLIALGHLKMVMDGKSQLKLTENAIEVLEGREEVFLRADYKKTIGPKSAPTERVVKSTNSKRVKKKSSGPKVYNAFDGTDKTLLENLKIFRTNLARQRRTQVYKIFPDKTLMEMVERRPTELHDLEDLYGVGPKKLKRYGKLFIDAISKLQN